MNRFPLSIVIICLLSVCSLYGKTFYYPDQENALFSMEVPDDWRPEVIDDGSLEGNSPDETGYMNAWILKKKEDFDSLGADIDELVDSWITDAKMEDEGHKIQSENTEFH